mmetsp:Transcript_21225/g.23046  ORF Transcript_21225/g.23046 Transcript_21225/m.23046 type:complete len:82 (-) Transcript_21225:39-284(-)
MARQRRRRRLCDQLVWWIVCAVLLSVAKVIICSLYSIPPIFSIYDHPHHNPNLHQVFPGQSDSLIPPSSLPSPSLCSIIIK